MRCLTQCQRNNLHLNISKTKEMLVDLRKQLWDYTRLSINGTPVERVDTFKYLSVQISDDLTMVKKARQRLYHLRKLKKIGASRTVQRCFYSCTIESILTGNIPAWYGNSVNPDPTLTPPQ